MEEAGNLLIEWINIEIAGYKSGVYKVKDEREPLNYNYLTASSIVRGVGNAVKLTAVRVNMV